MAPFRVDDGNFNIPLIVKSGYRFPFSERGDTYSFEYVIRQRFDKSVIRRSPSMTPLTTALGVAYLVSVGDLEDDGDGLFAQELVYACVPSTRTESAGMVYSQQIRSGFTAYNLTFPTSVEVVYDYGIGILEKIVAPRYFVGGQLLYRGDRPPALIGKIPVEDSEVTLYKGNIYQRKTCYFQIEQPKIADAT